MSFDRHDIKPGAGPPDGTHRHPACNLYPGVSPAVYEPNRARDENVVFESGYQEVRVELSQERPEWRETTDDPLLGGRSSRPTSTTSSNAPTSRSPSS